jgi:hypothetical protein
MVAMGGLSNILKIPKNPNRGKTQILDFKNCPYALSVHLKNNKNLTSGILDRRPFL